MATKKDLVKWVQEGLRNLKGRAKLVDVAKYIWKNYEEELKLSGDLYYTWQYDMRWAATYLRKRKEMVEAKISPNGIWELKE